MIIRLTLLFFIATSFTYAQDGNESIKRVSDEACNCISEISLSLSKRDANEEIKACISAAILNDQIKNSLMSKVSKAIDSIETSSKSIDSLGIKGENIIIADKNYEEIEAYLLYNCQSLKTLITNDNTENENSVSYKDKAIKFYNEAIPYFQKGDYKKASFKFKKAVKADKNFAFAWDNLGLCQRQLGKYKEAISSYKKSLKLDSKGRVPLMNIPIAYEYLKEYDNAINAYKEFSQAYPDDAEGYYGIGRMYHFKGDYENALENTFRAYLIYREMKSPYVQDAERNIGIFYNEMKDKGLLDVFNKVAAKYNIKVD